MRPDEIDAMSDDAFEQWQEEQEQDTEAMEEAWGDQWGGWFYDDVPRGEE